MLLLDYIVEKQVICNSFAFLSGINLLYLCLHGLCHSSRTTHHSSVYFKLSPMKSKTTNDLNYQAGDIITEDSQELYCIQTSIEVTPAEPENHTSREAKNGNVDLTIVESRLVEEDMDGDEKKAQIYSPNRKPQNGGDYVLLYMKYV